ncbi:hypothetical protein NC652_019679 [Populus alba x Populus x berolinensis]|nr:hypothetical protein NC652_019679 [Populus alba x Populus x berolinensis]
MQVIPKVAFEATTQTSIPLCFTYSLRCPNNELLSCTKMYDLPVQRDIRLSWSNPKCGYCEETGKL